MRASLPRRFSGLPGRLSGLPGRLSALPSRLSGLAAQPRRLVVVVAGGLAVVVVATVAVVALLAPSPGRARMIMVEGGTPGTVPPSAPADQPVPSPAPPAAGLKVIDYGRAPDGFPADPNPLSTTFLTEGVHPTGTIPVYDAPGGTARAYLAPTISGVAVTTPVVERRAGWVAVLLPSANRTIGWLAPGGWDVVALRDQLVVDRSSHQLTWNRDGALRQSWTVTLGDPSTPTPLGRTFVLGRSPLPGKVYAGIDVLALGNLPDDPNAVASGLRGAHIGIHSWYTADTFGKSVSNGCVRVPQAGQRLLLSELAPGTEVVVVD